MPLRAVLTYKNAEGQPLSRTQQQQSRQQYGQQAQQSRQQQQRVQQSRQQAAESHEGTYYRPGYYPPPPPSGYYYHDEDDWDDGEVATVAAALGAVGGYAAGRSSEPAESSATVVETAPQPSASLPCGAPTTAVFKGATYYPCGSAWYTQAYGSGGVIYMPVPSP
ncbi:uncharacterized protein sS8_0489 [Methylocaldum marinum]|uniref:Uncharacterized protein n=1 Tax=Methylocaldum marinum TaxID=1432792 RepID=A0A286P483_9GAMM|nr:uncharacterized protein sS8_0489 [Methylocaldum marinum]